MPTFLNLKAIAACSLPLNIPAIANNHRNTLKRNLYSNWPERLGDVILL
jgi:hypothetical protein